MSVPGRLAPIARGLACAAAALGAAALIAACGGGESGAAAGRNGGTVTVLNINGGVDSLDPGHWYYDVDYADLAQTTQRWLYGWKAGSTAPVADLATAMPVISDRGRTLTIHIRPGVHYSPPLASRTVTAADIKYAMERCFLASVGNGYAETYYGQIEGAPTAPAATLPDIRGLSVPNPTTLVIHTTRPVGLLENADALALPCTIPVPQSYAERYDRHSPSTYGMHAVFTGPYMIAGASSGTVPASGYQQGRLLVLVRNPSWSRSSDPIRAAHFNKIVFEGGEGLTVASREILEGRDMMSGDFSGPPAAVLQGALATRRDQLSLEPAGATRYISLNTSIAPLSNVDVRRAIAAALDRNALRLTVGGAELGALATHFIAPGVSGFAQAGGYAGPGYDFLASPSGNLPLARAYLRKAGYRSGRYTGPALLAVAADESPEKETAEAIQAQLAQIGIALTLREVPQETMRSKFCTQPKAMVAICPTLSWAKDFPDAQTMIVPVFAGSRIAAGTNTSQADNPRFNAQMQAAEALGNAAARASAWGTLDRELTGEAYVVPWLWENQISFASADVHGVPWLFDGGDWDLTASSLK